VDAFVVAPVERQSLDRPRICPVEVFYKATLSFAIKAYSQEELMGIGSRLRTEQHQLGALSVAGGPLDFAHQRSAYSSTTRSRNYNHVLDHPVRLKAVHRIETNRKKGRTRYRAIDLRYEEVIGGIALQGRDPIRGHGNVGVAGHEQPIK